MAWREKSFVVELVVESFARHGGFDSAKAAAQELSSLALVGRVWQKAVSRDQVWRIVYRRRLIQVTMVAAPPTASFVSFTIKHVDFGRIAFDFHNVSVTVSHNEASLSPAKKKVGQQYYIIVVGTTALVPPSEEDEVDKLRWGDVLFELGSSTLFGLPLFKLRAILGQLHLKMNTEFFIGVLHERAKTNTMVVCRPCDCDSMESVLRKTREAVRKCHLPSLDVRRLLRDLTLLMPYDMMLDFKTLLSTVRRGQLDGSIPHMTLTAFLLVHGPKHGEAVWRTVLKSAINRDCLDDASLLEDAWQIKETTGIRPLLLEYLKFEARLLLDRRRRTARFIDNLDRSIT